MSSNRTAVVEDEASELVEFGEGGRQHEVAPGGLKLLHEVGRAGEEHAVAVVDEPGADG